MNYQTLPGGFKFWEKFKYNPISDISFERYYGDDGFWWRKTTLQFCNEPDTIYSYLEIEGSASDSYTFPVSDVKRVIPVEHHNKIFYFLNYLGTHIILKGSFYDFPMSELLRYFDIAVLSENKFALCANRGQKAKVFDYLKIAAKNV